MIDRPARNRRRLQAYAEAPDPESRLHWRNLLVADNLSLVYAIAGRQSRDAALGFEDLAQVGSLGLIKAVEAFDPSRKVRFSSFAVPYIQGAMRQERRDRQALVRIPRPLWELHQQMHGVQEERRRQGLGPLRGAALAERLGCDLRRLDEVLALDGTRSVRSLDAPLAGGDTGGEAPATLLDLLAAPEDQADEPVADADAQVAERQWLRQQLEALDPQLRELLVGRIQVGCTWVELGRKLGMPPRQAQRRCDAALDRLRRAALAWREARERAGGVA
ncbi:MAG: hypothetical protein ER33_04095 [Cyanobium sp. CACIAM 14]|nr:MAG: hypothetical protein ER33_04095 [Cyanobium sp. CACIAM 14]